jgi:hypothetical protein
MHGGHGVHEGVFTGPEVPESAGPKATNLQRAPHGLRALNAKGHTANAERDSAFGAELFAFSIFNGARKKFSFDHQESNCHRQK